VENFAENNFSVMVFAPLARFLVSKTKINSEKFPNFSPPSPSIDSSSVQAEKQKHSKKGGRLEE
jgi:hypothetical protein